ncbi:Mu-like prophage major head subunit gpT family protein [Desulforegula conservatrix]|uniref:Mu-like prophage major head subunit gpT family protein n=1 Tax=Desulforegula conservatrix TaxID=153026 RepID=UPI000410A6B2|nr:Mu-like prophage major head subunit gpT family protein [Desulforegula conservatrix]
MQPINALKLKSVYTGFKTIFNDAFTKQADPKWMDVATLVRSSTAQETYGWMGSSTKFREWIGERVLQNLSVSDYTIKNKTFENTVTVPREAMEDDAYGVFSPMISQLGIDAKNHPDELVFALLAGGFTGLCYDGKAFFAADHPVKDANGKSQSVSNLEAGSGTPWMLLDVSGAVKPLIFQKRRDYSFVAMDKMDDEQVFTSSAFRYGVDCRVNAGYGLWQLAHAAKVDLNTENYTKVRAAMTGRKGDGGKPLNLNPGLLVVPPSLEKAALDIVKADRLANGADNVYTGSARVMVCPYLA